MDPFITLASDFVVQEFLPTMAALAAAAGREPLTWGVLALGALLWRRLHRT